jgi:atypical dual specificity phosphatase
MLNFSWLVENELAGLADAESEADIIWLKSQGIQALVRMTEKAKEKVTTAQLESFGIQDCHVPIDDYGAPTQLQIDGMVNFIGKSLSEKQPVGVSCGAGFGRVGAILACYLVSTGLNAETAILEVRTKRPGSIEMKEQEQAILEYATRLGTQIVS